MSPANTVLLATAVGFLVLGSAIERLRGWRERRRFRQEVRDKVRRAKRRRA